MLKKNYEFKKVLTHGKCFSGKYLIVFVEKNKCFGSNFLWLAISSKVAKAVGRNRLKRLIRESYSIEESKICDGYSIVFLWNKKQSPKCVSFLDICQDLKKIFLKAKLYK